VGIPVAGHVVEEVGVERALGDGQVSFEHATVHLFPRHRPSSQGAHAIAAAGAWVGTIASDRSGRCAPPTDAIISVMRALSSARVLLLAGSDAGVQPIEPATGLHCELRTLVAAGLTPFQALATATRNAGEFARRHLGEREPFGTIEVGARADLVLLEGDPRTDIGVVARVRGVVVRGVSISKR